MKRVVFNLTNSIWFVSVQSVLLSVQAKLMVGLNAVYLYLKKDFVF